MASNFADPNWEALTKTIAAMVVLAPEYVVVQVHGADGPNGGPYVQTLQEEDGYLTLEACSNSFLDVPLSNDQLLELLEMGWNSPEPEDGMPNYFRLVGPDATPNEVAEFLVRTLADVYKVSIDSEFEMAPLELFIEVVEGDFGELSGMAFVQNVSDPREVGF